MLSEKNLICIRDEMKNIITHGIPGVVVECGVGNGGAMLMAAQELRYLNDMRILYLFDKWDDMPRPEEIDGESANHNWKPDMCPSDYRVVAERFAAAYPLERLFFIRGDVLRTIPAYAPDQIAFLHLDLDWHRSTAHTLKHLAPHLSPGAAMLIDDYGEWDGCRKAVDDYLADKSAVTQEIDRTGLLIRMNQ